jgi:NAD(P)H-flavin reductase
MFIEIEKSYPLIKKIQSEKRAILYFNIEEKNIFPGQFFMLNYNLSQKPISVFDYDDGVISFLVESRGKTTTSMTEASIGDYFDYFLGKISL